VPEKDLDSIPGLEKKGREKKSWMRMADLNFGESAGADGAEIPLSVLVLREAGGTPASFDGGRRQQVAALKDGITIRRGQVSKAWQLFGDGDVELDYGRIRKLSERNEGPG
jgi:hypothetical protein